MNDYVEYIEEERARFERWTEGKGFSVSKIFGAGRVNMNAQLQQFAMDELKAELAKLPVCQVAREWR